MCMGVVTTIDIRDASNYDRAISYFLYVVPIAIATELKCICGYYRCVSNGLYIRDVSLSKCDGAILYVGMWHAIVRHAQE